MEVTQEIRSVRVDFQNSDTQGRVRLNTVAALADISALRYPLVDGALVDLIDDELTTRGVAVYDWRNEIWLAVINWQKIEDGGI